MTVSNKIHDLLAGLAVAASDTAGQREIAARAGGGVELYPSGDHVALASVLNQLLGSPDRLQQASLWHYMQQKRPSAGEVTSATTLCGGKVLHLSDKVISMKCPICHNQKFRLFAQ